MTILVTTGYSILSNKAIDIDNTGIDIAGATYTDNIVAVAIYIISCNTALVIVVTVICITGNIS